MAYDDLPLKPGTPDAPTPATPPPQPARASSPLRMIAVGVAGVVVGALLTWWWMGRTPPDPTTPAATTATDVAGTNRPIRQLINLPSLDASDVLLRELVGVLSRHPLLARLLATDGLVREATLAVVQIGDGRTPVATFEVLRPETGVQISGTETGRVDPASYERWDSATAALTSISPTELAQLYVNVKPLFDEAYWELGYPQGNFDDAIVRAIQVLDATPVPTEDPILVRRPEYFIHEDPALRSLEPVQKQFLLFGPANRNRVMTWLRQFAAALDLTLQ